MHEFFRRFARRCSDILGSAEVFLLALVGILVWAALGARYHYSDTWQLVINTATTIVTFLMVFIIQNTQSRDARAIQLKLDELIRVDSEARNELISLEAKPETAVEEVRSAFDELRDIVENEPPRGTR